MILILQYSEIFLEINFDDHFIGSFNSTNCLASQKNNSFPFGLFSSSSLFLTNRLCFFFSIFFNRSQICTIPYRQILNVREIASFKQKFVFYRLNILTCTAAGSLFIYGQFEDEKMHDKTYKIFEKTIELFLFSNISRNSKNSMFQL